MPSFHGSVLLLFPHIRSAPEFQRFSRHFFELLTFALYPPDLMHLISFLRPRKHNFVFPALFPVNTLSSTERCKRITIKSPFVIDSTRGSYRYESLLLLAPSQLPGCTCLSSLNLNVVLPPSTPLLCLVLPMWIPPPRGPSWEFFPNTVRSSPMRIATSPSFFCPYPFFQIPPLASLREVPFLRGQLTRKGGF